MGLESIQDRLGWVIQSNYSGIIKAKHENFLNFYEITAYITSDRYPYRSTLYKVDIFLEWEHFIYFFDSIKVDERGLKTIFGQIEEYIINNYANVYWLPKFINILKELELQYVSTFSFIDVTFPIFTNEFKFAELILDIKRDNFKELVEKYQNYSLNRWKTIESVNGIGKYTRR